MTKGSGKVPPNSAQDSGSAQESGETEIPYKRKPRFTSLRGVRREIGALYMDLMHGRVSQKIAATGGSLLMAITKTLEVEVLEARVGELEQRAEMIAAGKAQVSHARH